MQISTYIGKPVISPNGDAFGYVTDVRLARSFDKIACIVCADENEEEFYLPMRAVLSCADAVVAGRGRLQTPTGVSSPVGKKAYTQTGKALGFVSDVLLGQEGAKLVVADGEQRTEVPYENVQIGETAVVYESAVKRRAAPKKRESAPAAVKPTRKKAPDQTREQAPQKPQAILLNRTNLLGRRVRRSVYDDRGMPIAVAGERITPEVLSTARRAGRLLELAVNTITQGS